MSLHSPDTSQHLTITMPAATTLPQGGYTVAALCQNLAFTANFAWYIYAPSDFSKVNLYFDGDIWVDFVSWDGNLDISSPIWRWLVVTKAAGTATPRAHVATYLSSGTMTWIHADLNGTRPNAAEACDRISLGDEFGNGLRGDIACLAAFTDEFDDAGVASTFVRSSAGILAASPQFFVHFPEAAGIGSPFLDLAGSGEETIRTGSWSVSDDPVGFDFSLGRSGKPKTWSGATWEQHQAKVWNGTSWVPHSMAGHNGTEFVVAK